MTPQQSILNRYRPDLKPKSLYPVFHGAAADLANATGKGYADCVGEVFSLLARFAGCKVNSNALGVRLRAMHEDGTLLEKLTAVYT